MKIISWHGDGRLHRTWTSALATGETRLLLIPPNTDVCEADGRSWQSSYPVLGWFPQDAYYQVFVLLKQHTTEYYCNITLPVAWPATLPADIHFVDLDLDVFVTHEEIRVLDEAEFEARRGGYPNAWVEGARSGVNDLVHMAEHQQEVFSPANVARWRVMVANFLNSDAFR